MLHLIVALITAIQVQASPPARAGEAPLRILFFADSWAMGAWLKPEEAVASRLQLHLEKFLNRKVVIRSALAPLDLRQLNEQALVKLSEEPADYVFYFCNGSRSPVMFAARELSPWQVKGDSFWDYLGRQVGLIRLALQMRKSPRPGDVLLQPFDEVMSRLTHTSSLFGAKFALLWPGFPISELSWDLQIPKHWPFSMVAYLDILRPPAFVPADHLLANLRNSGVQAVVNFQISAYFTTIRAAVDFDSTQKMLSPDAQDDVAKMLAIALLGQEF